MNGKRIMNFWKEAICTSHHKDSLLTDCQDCGRIVPAQSPARGVSGLPYTQCDVCLASAVHSEDVGRALFTEVLAVLKEDFGFALPQRPPPLTFMAIPSLLRTCSKTTHGKVPRLVGGHTEVPKDSGDRRPGQIALPLAVS